jgi:DNA-binding CsgD family transcriptional regulator
MESQKTESKEKFELSPKKRIALELILAGQTDAQVGAAIGKGRNTIWSWRKHDAQFIAALNQRRSLLQSESFEQMNALCSQSIQLLEKAVEKGDTELALGVIQVLKKVISRQRLNEAPAIEPVLKVQKSSQCTSAKY